MSTTTNFKRIALVAVAALGLGVLSSVSSNATTSGVTLDVTDGTSTVAGGKSDSTTAAKLKIKGYIEALDSITITLTPKGTAPTGGAVVAVMNLDSSTSTQSGTSIDTISATGQTNALLAGTGATLSVLQTTVPATNGAEAVRIARATGNANIEWNFGVQLDSATAGRAAGTYTYSVTVKMFDAGSSTRPVSSITKDVNIVVAALATASKTAAAGNSTAILSAVDGSSAWKATATDSVLAVAGTASSAAVAAIKVDLLNAAGGTSPVDSLTVSIDKGNVSVGSGNCAAGGTGKNLISSYSAATAYVCVYPDGSTGLSTITIATKNAGSFTKTLTFYGTDVKSIVASSYLSVIGLGVTAGAATRGIKANAYDVNSTSFGANTAVYAYSSDTTVVNDYGTLCGWNTTDSVAYCDLTGVKAGTASITLRDAQTVALSTVASNAVSVRVSSGVLSSFTLTTDKASYAPGEKGYLIVTAKDAAGAVMPYKAVASFAARTFFDKSGISTTAALGNGSDSITVNTADVTIGVKFDRSSTPSSVDPIAVYTFYAPATAGTVTFSAKGGTLMSAAQQATASTATITVADSASAALAAVSALAVTVASLKTLITTLTNLVLKIQKKVKA